jgi:hypothetical protein
MFLKVYHKLMELYPHVTMDLVLQKGVGQEDICPDATFVGSEHEIDENQCQNMISLKHLKQKSAV